MNRYFVLSGGLHAALVLIVILLFNPAKQDTKATYTIDFIGSGKVIAMQQAAAKAASPAPEPAKQVAAPKPEPKAEAPKKTSKKAYDSKAEISAKKQKTTKKEQHAPEPLAAPSVLDDTPPDTPPAQEPAESAESAGSNEGDFEGGSIQTDFASFPYPWYITQVRNSLWSEWERRRPMGVTRAVMVSFAIAYDGKIKDLKVAKSSGDSSFDFAAKSAVINAGPFPALPEGYDKDVLTITVEFKQEK